jgi:excisionase family DNA binding protein
VAESVGVVTRTTPLADLPELLRAEEAGAWLGVSKGLVYAMAARGDLQSVRLGRLLRIRRDGLETAMRS